MTADYRALLLQVSGTKYLLVAVKPRGSAYENLDRYAFGVNPVSGGIEFMDVVDSAEAALSRGEAPAAALPGPAASPEPLFAAYSPSSCSSSASRSRCCR